VGVIPIKGTCQVEVIFKRDVLGAISEPLSLEFKPTNTTPSYLLNVLVKGEKVKVKPSGNLALSLKFFDTTPSVSDADFGNSRVEDVVSIFASVENTGTLTAKLVGQTLLTDAFKVQDSSQCLATIAPGTKCLFKIIFEAQEAKFYSAPLVLNYADEKDYFSEQLTNQLKGTKIKGATAPEIKISDYDAGDVNFGQVAIGSTYTKLIELKNINDQKLVVSLDDTVVTPSGVFNFSGNEFPGKAGTCSRLLTVGSCLIEVSFSPKELGPQTAQMKLAHLGSVLVTSKLIGEGISSTPMCEDKRDAVVFAEGHFNPKDSSVIYPYLESTPKSKVAKLGKLYGLYPNYKYDCLNCEAVKDAMVLSRFQLSTSSDQLVNASLQLDLEKIDESRLYLGTEMLCFQNKKDKRCSGMLFDSVKEPGWYALKNPSFFSARPGPVNDVFNNLMFHDTRKLPKVTTKAGLEIDRFSLLGTYSFERLFNLSLTESQSILRESFLNVIISDDTKNKNYPRLLLTFKKDRSCDQ
jgi:hypothetical protein